MTLVLACVCLGWAGRAAAATRLLRGHRPAAAANAVRLGGLDGDTPLNLSLGLPLRGGDQLAGLLADLYNPRSPRYRRFLRKGDFAARFGPTPADYAAVAAFAQAHGLQVIHRVDSRLVLGVRGRARDVEKAFGLTLGRYRRAGGGEFYAPDADPSVDEALPLAHVSGLDDVVPPRRASATAPPRANGTDAGSGPQGAYTSGDLRAAYAPGVSQDGSGQTVALYEFATGYAPADIRAYEQACGLPDVPLENRYSDGFDGSYSLDQDAPGEVPMDIEMAIAMAPGLRGVEVYTGISPDDILAQIAADDSAAQISSSWGMTDDSTMEAALQQMAAQGQAFFIASGDGPNAASDPASANPWVTSVGGTVLSTSGPLGSWQGESTWDHSDGGVAPYLIPSWQQPVSMALNGGSTGARNFPDVAMPADNLFVVFLNGQASSSGGTSASAPLWAGYWALANQAAAQRGLGPLGFANPALYAVGLSPNGGSDFHDIQDGSYGYPDASGNSHAAVKGYDLATGWGSPAGPGLINDLIALNPPFTSTATPTPTPTPVSTLVAAPCGSGLLVGGVPSQPTSWPGSFTNVTRVVLGADGSGETGRFKAFWDANYLYLGAEVSPSSLAVPPAGSLWQGEAVEFFLNMSGVPGSGFGAGDFQFIAGYGQPQVFEKDGHSAGVLVASQNQGGGAYTVAVAVPWSTLGVSPGTNATYGFDVAVDMDQNSGGVRTGQLAWAGNSQDYATTVAYGFLRLGLACGAATPTASPSPSATPLRSPTPTPTPSPLPTAQAGCAYYNQQAASQVLGQTDFSGSFANQVAVDNGSEAAGAATLDYPWGVYTDGTVLLAADTTNNRVLLWRHLPSGPDAPADLVIGQPDFASRNPNQGASYGSFGAPAANTLALPHGVCWDGTHLFIADTGNNRVLVYDGLPTANNAPAAFAIGMSSLTATSQGSVSAGLSQPMDVKSDGAHVVVADNGYNRVLVYNHVPTASGAVPDLALGQTSLSNTGANQGQPTPSASSLNRPYGVSLAGGRLLVADGSNNRVLIFNSLPGASGAAADLVVGQAGFSATGVHCGPDNLGGNALGVYSDGTRLFVASSANRVLVYNSFPTRSGAWADEALGQPGPGACMAPAGASATSLWPASLCGVPGGSTLYVADAARNRLLAFQCLNSPPTTTPSPGRSTTPSATATASPTATLTRTASATGTSSPSPTASATPSASRTASAGATASPSPTMTVSPGAGTTVTASPSGTPSPANTATASPSRTATAVNTATASPSRTATAVNTATASPSRTASAVITATVSPSRTPSPASTATPSASPTPGSGCTAGTPQLLDARGVANGCYQAANSLAYAVPAGSNLLLLRIENGSGALASTASYNGAALTLLRSDTDFSGGSLQTWRLVNPAAGSHSLSIQYSASNCSWNVAVEAYAGVDTATPIGATAFTQNTASCPPTSFSDTLVAQQAGSVVSDFMAIDVLPPGITLGGGQTGFNFSTGCCDNIYGDEKVAMAAGAVGLSYTFSQCKRYSSQLVEVRAACPPGQAPLEAHGLALGLPKTPQGGQPARLAAYPNPAGAAVQVAYRLPQAGAARLVLYSLDGEAVDTVELGERPAGDGQVRLGTGTCASGLYVLALLSDGGGAWQLQASFKMAVLH